VPVPTPLLNFSIMQCKALFFILFFPAFVNAQNLVPNGSFEDYISCPEYMDGMEFAEHWYKSIIYPGLDYYQNPSPDYFHECALNPIVGVPDNIIGNQMAHEGAAYSGLYTYEENWPNTREVVGVSLTSPLIPGQTYYCSMYFVRPVGWSAVGLATNNLGMKFSNTEIFSSTAQAVDGFAHLKVEEVAIDSVNWVLLYGEVVPEQSYQYLHIGNFFSDEETEVMTFSQSSVWAYYYIDDVRVSTDPLVVTSVDAQDSSRTLKMFPNPVNDILNIVSPRIVKNIQIYGITGQLVENMKINREREFFVNLSHISTGLYIGVVKFENGDTESIKINKL